MEEANRVSQVLKEYEKESRKKLNKEKTFIFFSKNTRSEVKEGVKELFKAQIIKQHEKYLGLPPLLGRGKKKAFNCIKDQVGRRIVGWKGKLLSRVGKEILIKVVAQATPTYTMNCFKIPDSLCKDLNAMVVRRKMKEKWLVFHGERCVRRKKMAGWVLGISRLLT